MSIDPEVLMAYADGELDAVTARRVEKAIAADPALGEQVARHRALRDTLRRHFDPVLEAPPPAALTAMLKHSAKVVDIASARKPAPVVAPRRWWSAGAVAAALALGVVLGQSWRPVSEFAARGGALVAAGETARALDTQLASAQPGDARVRMLVSFKAADGSYCRAFEGATQGGIACRVGSEWQIRQLRAVAPAKASEFRQAGSGELMAAAQEMMAGTPLDAPAERAAAAKGWRD